MIVKKSDLVIRNGTIIDGTGKPGFISDLGITDGIISAIGADLPTGTEEIDATGKLVTPGFIDVHTHYDAQVTWSSRITPSCLLYTSPSPRDATLSRMPSSA